MEKDDWQAEPEDEFAKVENAPAGAFATNLPENPELIAQRRADGHHLRHWADGGETSLNNLILINGRTAILDRMEFLDFLLSNARSIYGKLA